MEVAQSARQFGVSIILFTLLFRLFESGLPQKLLPEKPIQKETGLSLRSYSFFPYIPESSPPTDYTPVETLPSFPPEAAEGIGLVNFGKEEPDLEALLARPLTLSLAADAPTVLILHTHTTESYTQDGERYSESGAYRTLDEKHNMLAIGDRVAELLERAGIGVIHDRQLHDYPAYSTAYTHARKAIRAELKDNPQIQLVLDLHRDAADSGGEQLRTRATIRGRAGAQLMIVSCCGSAALSIPDWQDNLALALKLQATLEEQCPGITRPISLRTQRFNQDLSPGALLIEVGAAGNTQAEAELAAEQLARAIIALKDGAAAGA